MAFALVAVGCTPAPKQETPAEAAKAAQQPAKITQFYAVPAAVPKGEAGLLCYGVESAATIRIEPPVEGIGPSLARCVEIRPAAATTYTLFARGAGGDEVKQQVAVTIGPKRAPESKQSAGEIIKFFATSETSTAAGSGITLCYGVTGAKKVTLAPPARDLIPSDRACVTTTVAATTEFVLTASDAAGRSETQRLKITVK